MKSLLVGLCLVAVAQGAGAQLVVFDNSHAPGHAMYDTFIAHLETWGYTVEKRTTPLTDNDDADVIVILPEDAYTMGGTDYTPEEVAWLRAFVDSGRGLFAGMCPSMDYWQHITGLLDEFGIALGDYICNPAYYTYHISHPIFEGVAEMGDTMSYCLSLNVSAPSFAAAYDGLHDYVALYEADPGQPGAALWVSHYRMAAPDGLYDYDNLRFLANAFAWLSDSVHVANESATWGDVKRLYD